MDNRNGSILLRKGEASPKDGFYLRGEIRIPIKIFALNWDRNDCIAYLSLSAKRKSILDIRDECAESKSFQVYVGGRYYMGAGAGYYGPSLGRYKTKTSTDGELIVYDRSDAFVEDLDQLMPILLSDRYTTPLLEEWESWLSQELQERGNLRAYYGWGNRSGSLQLTNDQLDEVVSTGVRSGSIKIE